MIYETDDDAIHGKFHCSRCGALMWMKVPISDERLIEDKKTIIRLLQRVVKKMDKTCMLLFIQWYVTSLP